FPPILSSPLPPPLFPYTTLFRSRRVEAMVVRLRFGLRFVLGLVLRLDLARLVLRFGDLGRRGAAVRLLDHRAVLVPELGRVVDVDRKSTRLNSSHVSISYAVFCL